MGQKMIASLLACRVLLGENRWVLGDMKIQINLAALAGTPKSTQQGRRMRKAEWHQEEAPEARWAEGEVLKIWLQLWVCTG